MKVFFLKKSTLKLLAVFVILAALCTVNISGLPVASIYFGQRLKKVPIYNVQTDEKKVAISFDAAWGADKTEEIMAICEQFGVKATFFLVGFWIEDYPEMAKKIADNGFEVGIHSNTHPNMTKLNVDQVKLELTENLSILKECTSVEAKLFRAPFGAYNDNLISCCEELDLKVIQWDVDSLDWKGLSGSQLAGRVTSKVKNGSIVLFHNNSDNIIQGLKMVLEDFKTNNIKAVPVGELIYNENYTINQQGTQIKT